MFTIDGDSRRYSSEESGDEFTNMTGDEEMKSLIKRNVKPLERIQIKDSTEKNNSVQYNSIEIDKTLNKRQT